MRGVRVTLIVAMVGVLGVAFALAAPSEHLNWGGQLNSGPAACPAGSPVINVAQKVINDIDSGEAGNYWAVNEYVRRIQVVQVASNQYCATVTYEGSFTTVDTGFSPGGVAGALDAGVVGTFQGGRTALITGTLNPTLKTRGSIGTFDYGCDPYTGICSSYTSWVERYFDIGFTYHEQSWGWVYHAGNNGSWLNADGGNSGDITGN